MAESGGSNTRYPYYHGPEGSLVLVDSALEQRFNYNWN